MREAVVRLDAGDLAVLPAEGVYGLHARPDRPRALGRLRAVKEREAARGWILLVDGPERLRGWGVGLSATARALIARHWPGALTLVLPAATGAPDAARAGDGSIAVRCPGSDFLREVVRAAGGALLSTSANRPGAPPPARVVDVEVEAASLAVDGGTLSGIPSTLARVDGSTVRVLRSGPVPASDLEGDEA